MNRAECAAVELFDFDGNAIIGRTVESDGKRWYAKTAPQAAMADRDLLGYLLGAGAVNVAEIRRLENPAAVTLPDGTPWRPRGAHELLVRLGQDYVRDELPLRDLDEAVAYELVFSLWIRRRDTHAGNKWYVDRLPLFFDHHAAFDDDHRNVDIGFFLHPEHSDEGHGGSWRVKAVAEDASLDIKDVRQEHRRLHRASHYVHDIDRTIALMENATSWVDTITNDTLSAAIRRAALPTDHATTVHGLLLRTQASLRQDVGRLRDQLSRNR